MMEALVCSSQKTPTGPTGGFPVHVPSHNLAWTNCTWRRLEHRSIERLNR